MKTKAKLFLNFLSHKPVYPSLLSTSCGLMSLKKPGDITSGQKGQRRASGTALMSATPRCDFYNIIKVYIYLSICVTCVRVVRCVGAKVWTTRGHLDWTCSHSPADNSNAHSSDFLIFFLRRYTNVSFFLHSFPFGGNRPHTFTQMAWNFCWHCKNHLASQFMGIENKNWLRVNIFDDWTRRHLIFQ